MSLKNDIYGYLKQNTGGYVSGQELALRFEKSRAAVWKAVKALRADGCEISAVNNRGYRLLRDGGKISAEQIAPLLKQPVEVLYYESIDSTNSQAKRLIAAGESRNLLVIANTQTGGRGRGEKSFYSPADSGVYMSLVVHPKAPLQSAVSSTTAAAVALCRAIETFTDLTPQIKWVNDIYLGSGKVAGILTEAITDFESMSVSSVIIGIGVNINTKSFPAEAGNASSLGADIERNALIVEIVNQIFDITVGGREYMEDYKSRSMVIGRDIMIYKNGAEIPAKALSVEDSGALKVQLPGGEVQTLTSGTIRLK